MKRKHKQYSKPKRPFDKVRIDEEAEIKNEFGLKNKKEIWRADSQIGSIREKAKKLIGQSKEKQEELFKKLKKKGLNANSIADALGLEKRDYLNRRLQTVVFRKKIAPTIKAARQMITHKKILVDNVAVDSPSYIVPVELEDKITLKSTDKEKDNKSKKDGGSNKNNEESKEKNENNKEGKE